MANDFHNHLFICSRCGHDGIMCTNNCTARGNPSTLSTTLWASQARTAFLEAKLARYEVFLRETRDALREAGKHVDSTNVYRDFFQYLPEAISEELRESADEGHLDPVKGIQQDEWLTRKPTKSE